MPVLFAVFAAMGLFDGVADITQNHLLFQVQRRGERSLPTPTRPTTGRAGPTPPTGPRVGAGTVAWVLLVLPSALRRR